MTPARKSQIETLIANDAIAKGHFDAGRYGDCALRLGEIAPPVRKPLPLSEMGIMAIYSDDPMTGEIICQTIEGVSQGNPIVARMRKFLGPGVGPESLPDFSLPGIRQALTAPIHLGGLGLTEQQAAPLLRAGEKRDTFSGLDIEHVAQTRTA